MEDILIQNKKNEINAYRANQRLKRTKVKTKTSKAVLYTFLTLYVIISLFPFFWSLVVSFRESSTVTAIGVSPFSGNLIWTADNYKNLFNSSVVNNYAMSWITNSLVYSILNASINAFFNFLAGYALSRLAFRGRNLLIWYILVALMIPSQATQIPQYLIMLRLGLIGAGVPWIVWMTCILSTGMTSGILIFQIRQFYLNQSAAIEEAGFIDGLSRFKVFLKVSLRSMLPVLAMQWAAVFIGSWNNFILFQLWSLGSMDRLNWQAAMAGMSQTINGNDGLGKALAASNISIFPVMIVYIISLYFQKRVMVNGEK